MRKFNIINKNILFDNNAVYNIAYSITMPDDRDVYYLINVNDFSDIKFCHLVESDEYEEIFDKEELKEIVGELCTCINTFIK